jgi:hypothetical protein
MRVNAADGWQGLAAPWAMTALHLLVRRQLREQDCGVGHYRQL